MLKLLKYEFRKCRTLLLTLLAVTAALESYFLISLHLVSSQSSNENHLAISIGLLVLATYVVAILVFVKGITSYSSELKDRSAYLIFMTPTNGLQIMASKFLFTILLGTAFAVLYAVMGAADTVLLLREMGELEEFLDMLQRALMFLGIGLHYDQMALAVAACGIYILLSVLSVVALSYLAITLSHTLFRDKKGRGIVAVLIFFALNWLVNRLYGLLPNVLDSLVYVDASMYNGMTGQAETITALSFSDVLRGMVPQGCVSLGVILLSLFGCAWMLDRKVSL